MSPARQADPSSLGDPAELRVALAVEPVPADGAVLALYATGRARWREVALDREAWLRRVGGRISADDAARIHAGDLFLACACAEGDARALAAFDAAYLGRVPGYLASLHKPATFVDDVT